MVESRGAEECWGVSERLDDRNICFSGSLVIAFWRWCQGSDLA